MYDQINSGAPKKIMRVTSAVSRMHTLKDKDILLDGLGSNRYKWQKGIVKKSNNKKLGTFVLGVPIQIA